MDDGRLLVVCKDDSTLEVIDVASGQHLGVVAGSGFTPHEVVASEDGRLAYLPVYSDAFVGQPGSDGRRIDVVDLVGLRRIGEIPLLVPSRPHLPVLLPGDRLLVSTELDESVTVIDRRSLRVAGRLPTGQAESHMFAVTGDSARLVSANVGPGTVSVVDVASGALLGVIPVAEKINRICLEPQGRFAYTADQNTPRMGVIDIALLEHAGWIDLPSIGFGAAVSSDGRLLIVALRQDREIAVLDRVSGQVIHRVPSPAHPQAIVLHPDGIRAFSACDVEDCVVEIDIRAGAVLRTISTGRNPDGIAWSATPAGPPGG